MDPPTKEKVVRATRYWAAELLCGWKHAPGSCCYAVLCQPCALYHQRVELLAFTGEPYSCCQRKSFPHSACCCCRDAYVPPPVKQPDAKTVCQPCLCLEVLLCPCIAVRCTRRLMQHKWGVKTSKCTCLTICGLSLAGPHWMPVLTACLSVQQQAEFDLEQKRRIALLALKQGIGTSGPVHQTMEIEMQ